jgi:hypothetical protein
MTGPALPRQSASVAEQLTWLRGQIRLFARDLALAEMLGRIDPAAATDQLGAAADGFAGLLDAKVHDDVIRMAVQAEQLEAAELVRVFMEQLRKRIQFLTRGRATSPELVAAGRAVCARHNVFMPRHVLRALLIDIASGALPYQFQPRRRHVA